MRLLTEGIRSLSAECTAGTSGGPIRSPNRWFVAGWLLDLEDISDRKALICNCQIRWMSIAYSQPRSTAHYKAQLSHAKIG